MKTKPLVIPPSIPSSIYPQSRGFRSWRERQECTLDGPPVHHRKHTPFAHTLRGNLELPIHLMFMTVEETRVSPHSYYTRSGTMSCIYIIFLCCERFKNEYINEYFRRANAYAEHARLRQDPLSGALDSGSALRGPSETFQDNLSERSKHRGRLLVLGHRSPP